MITETLVRYLRRYGMVALGGNVRSPYRTMLGGANPARALRCHAASFAFRSGSAATAQASVCRLVRKIGGALVVATCHAGMWLYARPL
jgi:hypothetical protein